MLCSKSDLVLVYDVPGYYQILTNSVRDVFVNIIVF